MKKFLPVAALALVFAGCTSNEFVGDLPDVPVTNDQMVIDFGSGSTQITRAAVGGEDAANLLGREFRVYGTVVKDGVTSPVFDNYVVAYVGNAGADSTNTNGWTYLGLQSKGEHPANQDVKYWDLDAARYDFVAFAGLPNDLRIVSSTSNTFDVDQNSKDQIFVSDRVTSKYQSTATGNTKNHQYGKGPVTLNFKRLAARLRLGIYETVPGYAVKDVKFYYGDSYLAQAGTSTETVAGLRGTFPVSGTVTATYDENNIVQVDFNGPETADNFQFGKLEYTTAQSSLVDGGYMKEDGTVDATGDAKFLSTTSAIPTWAKKDAVLDGQLVEGSTWQTVLPYASNPMNLVLRVDFTLVALDGVGAPIEVKGASAVVPVEYAKWKPNYAYTYIFKISDKTNGTTGPANPNPQDPDDPNPDPEPPVDPGLYPITFDATVSSVEDYNQETITGITSLGGDAITTYSETSDVTNAGEYYVGEKITVSSYSHGQWKVAYSASEPTEQGVADNNTYTYDIIGGQTTDGKTIDQCSVTSAQFTAEQAGYYIVWLRYLPHAHEDVEGNYVDVFKVVKVVNR